MDVDIPTSPLLSLPLEILLNITCRLKTPDYCNVRSSCKTIEATLLNAFAREFFTKRQFMLTEFSLQALIDMSKSRFSSNIKHVIIGLERPWSLDQLPYVQQIGPNYLDNQKLLQSIYYTTFLNSGQGAEMLIGAFSSLPNLETIGLRDFNSRSRWRDFPDLEWRSYGYNSQGRDIFSTVHGPGGNIFDSATGGTGSPDVYVTSVFQTILRALGKASSKPKNLEVILRRLRLYDHSFHLPGYYEVTIQPVLANLRTLFLDLSPDRFGPSVRLNGELTPCINYFLLNFLFKLTNLEHLRLNFKHCQPSTRNDVLYWLSRDQDDTTSSAINSTTGDVLSFPPSVDFAHLRELEIGWIYVDSESLLNIIKKYRKTLRAISFHRVNLIEADTVDADSRVNLWTKLLKQMSKLDLKLDSMNMSHLTQMKKNYTRRREVHFKDHRDPLTRKWAGTDIQSGLRDFISEIVMDRLKEDSEVESFEDSEISNSDDDGDGGVTESDSESDD